METTFYPAAGANSPVDGYMTSAGTGWDTQHDLATANSTTSATATIMRPMSNIEGSTYRIARCIILFDITSLLDSEVISAVDFYGYATGKDDPENDAQSYVTVVNSTPDSNAAVTQADYNQVGDATNNPTKYSDDIDITGVSTSAYNKWTGNATMISFVQTAQAGDNIVKLGLREGHDIEDVAPDVSDGEGSRITLSTADVAGTSQDPKLVVTHAPAAVNTSDFFLMF